MSLSKRAASGTLSELFGRATLRVDRLFRRVWTAPSRRGAVSRCWRPALLPQLPPSLLGVNAGRTVGLPRRPHEFVLLRARPTEFTALDVIAILKLQSFAIPSNWDSELARLMVLKLDGPDALRDLDPAFSGVAPGRRWPQPVSPARLPPAWPKTWRCSRRRLGRAAAPTVGQCQAAGPDQDAPCLPTIPISLPPSRRTGTWRRCSRRAGLSPALLFPGTPAIAVGHNGNCAWGVTAGLTDNTDLFLERIGTDGRSVLEDGEYVRCETRREVIRVRGAKPVEEEVLVTPRGPIISPALDGELGAVSMKAVWLDSLPVRGFLGTQEARTFEEFRSPFADWPILPLNLVYADTNGNVGYQLVGQAPRRRRGYGTVPGAGWVPRAGWEEEGVPFDEMPRALNPALRLRCHSEHPSPNSTAPGRSWESTGSMGTVSAGSRRRWKSVRTGTWIRPPRCRWM